MPNADPSLPQTAMPAIVASTTRHLLTALAGLLVGRGLLNAGNSAGVVEVVTGLVLGLIGYGWSLARAGRLGSQAKTIAALMDRLLGSPPPPLPGTTVSTTADLTGATTTTTISNDSGPVIPASWPPPPVVAPSRFPSTPQDPTTSQSPMVTNLTAAAQWPMTGQSPVLQFTNNDPVKAA